MKESKIAKYYLPGIEDTGSTNFTLFQANLITLSICNNCSPGCCATLVQIADDAATIGLPTYAGASSLYLMRGKRANWAGAFDSSKVIQGEDDFPECWAFQGPPP